MHYPNLVDTDRFIDALTQEPLLRDEYHLVEQSNVWQILLWG